jgi:glycosyltransferase involved in cell wall biosynthesis
MGTEAVVIVVPVLGRPHRVAPLMASVEDATPEPHRTLFVVNDNDVDELTALREAGADFMTVPAKRGSWACKINDGYRASTEPYLFTGADDIEFHPGWFTAAVRLMTGPVQVVGTTDLCNPRTMDGDHSTHTLIARTYVDEHGTIDKPAQVLHEGYHHDYADDELIATAKARGVYAHGFESVVEHLHPWAKKAPDDATYRLGRRWRQHGRRLFERRQRLWQRLSS